MSASQPFSTVTQSSRSPAIAASTSGLKSRTISASTSGPPRNQRRIFSLSSSAVFAGSPNQNAKTSFGECIAASCHNSSMIERRFAGIIPPKPHTAFRDDKGKLFYEETFTRGGFSGPLTYFYHENPITPTTDVAVSERGPTQAVGVMGFSW